MAIMATIMLSLSSCYSYTVTVGEGSKTGVEYKQPNHYLFGGLATLSTADAKEMAGDAKDYEVTVKHTFVDGLLNGLTFGIYSPTTTIVRK